MSGTVATIGEILVEMMALEKGAGFTQHLHWEGPFASGAPAIFIDQVAKLGHSAAIVSAVGDDDFGRLNLERLRGDGVGTNAVEVMVDEVTATAFVRYRADGDRDFHFNLAHSAYRLLRPTVAGSDVLANCEHLHVSGSSLLPGEVSRFVREAVEQVADRGGTISFDPNIRPQLARNPQVLADARAIVKRCSIFLPSEAEIGVLTSTTAEPDIVAELQALGVGCVVIKRGQLGSTYYDETGRVDVPAFVVAEVDPTGAGDCFDATFVVSRLHGADPEQCLKLANAAGARAVLALGPMEGTSTMAELEDVLHSGCPLHGPESARAVATMSNPKVVPSRFDRWLGYYGAPRGTAGLASVCSSHDLVLEAALTQALEDGLPVLIEPTCNQVNHLGGYTGMTPAAFRDKVAALASKVGLTLSQVILGGDHLGPNPWKNRPAEEAMAEAQKMVAAYVGAGFSKIHLDTSMGCAGEPKHLDDEVTAQRAAQLASVAEKVARERDLPVPFYVIGTEVPTPGGMVDDADEVHVTSPEALRATVAAHRRHFEALGLQAAFERVIAVVVHPGVEFNDQAVFEYDDIAAKALVAARSDLDGLAYEAHSTDYQPAARLSALVRDGFAVLKVGPGLTYALREGLYALDSLACWLMPGRAPGALPAAVEEEMLENPAYWQPYYSGDAVTQRLLRHFSYSDRVRYYWPSPRLSRAVEQLFEALDGVTIPTIMVRAFFPHLYNRVTAGQIEPSPRRMLIETVRDVLRAYSAACVASYPSAQPCL